MKKQDVVIIGSGPNGLSAGIFLAMQGLEVLILEKEATVGGGMRTAECTLPGFHHDICSAVHPMGYLSPWFKQLHLENFGLEWVFPKASVAHPLDNQPAVILEKSLAETAKGLGIDAGNYQNLLQPFIRQIDNLLADTMKPIGWPDHPVLLAEFGWKAILPASIFGALFFKNVRAKALFAGCAAHSILPFDKLFTSAMGLLFLATGHAVDWPVVKGGTQNLAEALLQCFLHAGGKVQFQHPVNNFRDLPAAQAYIFDTDPVQLSTIANERFPSGYARRLQKYNFGPGVFKIDYALEGSIPWKDQRCLEASTVHVGGTLAEIAAAEKDSWVGKHPEKPFVLVSQQSQFDTSRSPQGKHTAWAYCHVPFGSEKDMTREIENQLERFAPGFRDLVLARKSINTRQFQTYNPNYVGGAVTGGATDISQLFTRPVARWDPYSTPDPAIFICSASTPPGGGVHGMNGFHAARSVYKKCFGGK